MKYNYSNHYAVMNKIDLQSEESLKAWFNKAKIDYKFELDKLLGDNYKSKLILELGCGIGGILNFLKQNGCTNIFGIDISKEQVEICRKYVTDKVVQSDVFDYLITNSKKYDIIIMFDLLEHIQKNRITELLKLVYNSLSPNGIVIIRTPNMGSIIAPYGRYLDFTHDTGFTSESLQQVLSESEFTGIDFFNSAIGRKRIYLLKLIHKILSSMYRTRYSEIVTANILATAKKSS
jgi:2-polyprenyl-3-methyl-5-hydroxy-6-metoxy-1,4-benzoquinol methylase